MSVAHSRVGTLAMRRGVFLLSALSCNCQSVLGLDTLTFDRSSDVDSDGASDATVLEGSAQHADEDVTSVDTGEVPADSDIVHVRTSMDVALPADHVIDSARPEDELRPADAFDASETRELDQMIDADVMDREVEVPPEYVVDTPSETDRVPEATDDIRPPDDGVADAACDRDLDEEFASPEDFTRAVSAGCWGLFNKDKLESYSVGAGVLRLVPTPQSAFFRESTGPIVYRTVTDDFVVETSVVARNWADSVAVSPPAAPWLNAGIVVYDPSSSIQQNDRHIVLMLGTLDVGMGLKTEFTIRPDTNQTLVRNGVYSALLRVCRVGGEVRLYSSPVERVAWTRHNSYPTGASGSRGPWPRTVHVGVAATQYQAGTAFKLQAEFDYVRFRTPISSESECTAEL